MVREATSQVSEADQALARAFVAPHICQLMSVSTCCSHSVEHTDVELLGRSLRGVDGRAASADPHDTELTHVDSKASL
jgi:hypothetical protein